MRLSLALALLVALTGCSLVDLEDTVPFRALTQAQADGPLEARIVPLASQAEVEAYLAATGITATVTADFARETVVAVATPGACPATNYRVAVRSVTLDRTGLRVRTEVERVGDAGGDALTYPVAFIAVEDLSRSGGSDPFDDGVLLLTEGDAAGDCPRESSGTSGTAG